MACVIGDIEEGMLELELGPQKELPAYDNEESVVLEWESGVEVFQDLTKDQLWEYSGMSEKRIPYFNSYLDVNEEVDLWSKEWCKL